MSDLHANRTDKGDIRPLFFVLSDLRYDLNWSAQHLREFTRGILDPKVFRGR
jgi:hypothetical protein